MEASTPEALNAQLLARIGELEREVADLRARVAKGKSALPSVDDIRRVRRAAHGAMVNARPEPNRRQRHEGPAGCR